MSEENIVKLVSPSGQKKLQLEFDPQSRTYFEYLTSDASKKKVEGETTALFAQAFQSCQRKANELGEPVIYRFEADRNTPMYEWALHKASRALNGEWDRMDDQGRNVFFYKTFYPTRN